MREFEYIPGRIVELVPLERSGYGIGSWKVVQGNVTIVDNKFTMPDEDVRITATYEAILYQLIIEGQNGEQSGAGSYKFEQDVNILATPNPGYDFDRWEGLELANEASTGFKMPPNNLTITAIYTAKKYSVIVNGSNGTQQGSGSEYTVNQNVNIVAEPNTGYRFTEWQVNSGGISAPGSSSDSFLMPANDVEITAIYNLVDYTVQVIGADGGGTYNMGDTVTLSSTPSAGYQFSSWNVISGGVSVLANSFTMPANNVEIEAVYEAKKYTVTINGINGTQTGAGSNYIIGDRVNITATPNTGYNFTEWIVNSGGVSISSDSFDMPDNNVVITAVYTAIEYDVSITGIHGTQSHTGGKYKMGDTVSIQYTPNTGYEFDYWNVIQGGVSVYGNSFTMPAGNVSIEIVYRLINYTLTINGVNGSDPGLVSGNTYYYQTQTGAGSYVMGEEVELEAIPSIGWEFYEWQGHTFLNKDSSTTKLIMPASDLTITAVYKIKQYTVTVTGGTGGGQKTYGETVNISASPPTGYEFDGWTVVGSLAEARELFGLRVPTPSDSFIMPARDVTLEADFKPKQYTVTVNGGTGGGTKDYNSVVNLVATPDVGYELVDWTINSGGITISSNSFTMPDNDVEVTANFQLKKYTVTVNGGTLAWPSSLGGGQIAYGETVYIGANPPTGYELVDWTVNSGDVTILSNEVNRSSFTMPDSNVEVTANFQLKEYTVTLQVRGLGTGTLSGAGTYKMGDSVTVSTVTGDHSVWANWYGTAANNTFTDVSNQIQTFIMPAHNIGFSATYNPIYYQVETSVGSGSGTVSNPGNKSYGQTVSISATASSGYDFSSWTVLKGGIAISPAAVASFSMPGNDVSIQANFVGRQYTVKRSTSAVSSQTDGGSSSVQGGENQRVGETVTINISPDSYHELRGIVIESGASLIDWREKTNLQYGYRQPWTGNPAYKDIAAGTTGSASTIVALQSNSFTMPAGDIVYYPWFVKKIINLTIIQPTGTSETTMVLAGTGPRSIKWDYPGSGGLADPYDPVITAGSSDGVTITGGSDYRFRKVTVGSSDLTLTWTKR